MALVQADSVSPAAGVAGWAARQHKEFRPDIEGLRAVAVLAVVLFHADMPGVGGGFVGVDVFFVISGFLITGLLWREVSSAGTVRAASVLRGAGPPTAAGVGRWSVSLTMIGAAALLPPLQVAEPSFGTASPARCMSATTGSSAEGVHYFGGHLPPSPFQHYWSLGVEEQFYLVWPASDHRYGVADPACASAHQSRGHLIGTPRTRWSLVLVAVVSFALSLVITYVMPAAAFFSLPTRAWQLALGRLGGAHRRPLAPRQGRYPPRSVGMGGPGR